MEQDRINRIHLLTSLGFLGPRPRNPDVIIDSQGEDGGRPADVNGGTPEESELAADARLGRREAGDVRSVEVFEVGISPLTLPWMVSSGPSMSVVGLGSALEGHGSLKIK